jgi:hypothetical protein
MARAFSRDYEIKAPRANSPNEEATGCSDVHRGQKWRRPKTKINSAASSIRFRKRECKLLERFIFEAFRAFEAALRGHRRSR